MYGESMNDYKMEEIFVLLGQADAHLCSQSLIIDRQYIHDKIMEVKKIISDDYHGKEED